MKNGGKAIKSFLDYPGVRVLFVLIAIVIIVVALIKAGWMPKTLGLSIMGGARGQVEPNVGPFSLPVGLTAMGMTSGGYQVAGENGFSAQGGAMEGFSGDDSADSVVLYFRTGCPHCQAWKNSEFPRFMEAMKKEMPNVKVMMFDGDNAEDRQNFPSDIEGVPSVRVTRNGKMTEYNGERNADALMNFVKQLQ